MERQDKSENEKIKKYYFKIEIVGCGDTDEEAWGDAVDGFCLDPGSCPEKDEYRVEEEEL